MLIQTMLIQTTLQRKSSREVRRKMRTRQEPIVSVKRQPAQPKECNPKKVMVRLCKPRASRVTPDACDIPRTWLEALELEEDKIESVLSEHRAIGSSNIFISNSHFHHNMFNCDNEVQLSLKKGPCLGRSPNTQWISPYPRHKRTVEKLGLKFEEDKSGLLCLHSDQSTAVETGDATKITHDVAHGLEPERTPTPPATPPPPPQPLTPEEQLDAKLREMTYRYNDQTFANDHLQALLNKAVFKLEACEEKVKELENRIAVLLQGRLISYEKLRSHPDLQRFCVTTFQTGKCIVGLLLI